MSNIKQTFTIIQNNELLDGNYVLSKDSSLMYSIPAYGSFQLLLGNGYHMSLGIDRETGKCLTFDTLLDAITFELFSSDLCDIHKATLIFKCDSLKNQEGDHYIPFVEKKYYDDKNLILAFGDINSEGIFIEFSNNTYAKLDGERLTAVYIRVPKNVIDKIKAKHKTRFKHFW